jgi:hypothetical protein
MSHKVTVYSNWEKTSARVHEFETLEEAEQFAQKMKEHQYIVGVFIDEIDEETDSNSRE